MEQRRNTMTALLDASSAIILYKANLHLIVCEMYNVVMPVSVYGEITENSYPGAAEYQQLQADRKITVKTPSIATLCQHDLSGLHTLDKGERDVIQLYYAGNGDFIIADDGAAAKYCKREQIRFINALLIPMIIKCTGKQNEVYCRTAFNKIKNLGRYSRWVITFAEQCDRKELSFFLP